MTALGTEPKLDQRLFLFAMLRVHKVHFVAGQVLGRSASLVPTPELPVAAENFFLPPPNTTRTRSALSTQLPYWLETRDGSDVRSKLCLNSLQISTRHMPGAPAYACPILH